MAHILEDRVLVTTQTTGTGAITLGGPVLGYLPFSGVMANGDTCWYLIQSMRNGNSGPDWEEGIGTWNTGNTLSRTTVIRSSNANAAVTFAAGAKRVALTIKAPTDATTRGQWRTALGLGPLSILALPGGSTNFLREDGTWQPAGGAGAYLPLTGGTLTGNLTMTTTAGSSAMALNGTGTSGSSNITLSSSGPSGGSYILTQRGANIRWAMYLGNGVTESGSNVGSDFQLTRFSDAGAAVANPITIARSSGAVVMGSGSGAVQTLTLLSTNAANLQLTDVTSAAGPQITWANGAANRTHRLRGSIWEQVNSAYSAIISAVDDTGRLYQRYGYATQQAVAGGDGGNTFNFWWNGNLNAYIDATFIGAVTLTSDERVKQNIRQLAPVAGDILYQIKPIAYEHANVGIFRADGVERWGFSAQQLMGIGLHPAVDGDINAVQANGDPQPAALDVSPIVALLVIEVQKLRAELNALKGN